MLFTKIRQGYTLSTMVFAKKKKFLFIEGSSIHSLYWKVRLITHRCSSFFTLFLVYSWLLKRKVKHISLCFSCIPVSYWKVRSNIRCSHSLFFIFNVSYLCSVMLKILCFVNNVVTSFCFIQDKKSMLHNFLHVHKCTRTYIFLNFLYRTEESQRLRTNRLQIFSSILYVRYIHTQYVYVPFLMFLLCFLWIVKN